MLKFISDALQQIYLRNIIIFIKNYIIALKNNSIIINRTIGTKCPEMGLGIRTMLNPLEPSHLNIIQDQNQVDDNVLGIIHYLSEKNLVIFSNNILLINFIFFTLNKRFTLFTTKNLKLSKKIKYILLVNKKKINNYIHNGTFILDDLKIINTLPAVNDVSILSKKIIKNKKYNTYKYLNGRLFKLNSKNKANYFFITKKQYLKRQKKKKISGFTSIKSFEIFPFDLCYESILPHVDELILGIDSASLTYKRKKILNKFLSQTKYKKKIKIVYVDFKTKIFNKFKTKGRWIANINNYLLNYCSGEYCLYIQADEFNADKNLKKKTT